MAERRSDFSARPSDPAGTKSKVDEESLLPSDSTLLLPPDAEVIDSTAEEEFAEAEAVAAAEHANADVVAAHGNMLPERRAAAGVGPVAAPIVTPHAPRFQFLLGMLIALGVAAVALVGALIINNKNSPPGIAWSAWHPSSSGGNPAQQIADHVGPEYKLPSGHELVAVTGGPLEVAGLPMTVALRSDPNNGGNISLVSGTGVLYRLCGLASRCAIDEGKASVARHVLLQREALELALYTFRYVSNVNQVVVFLPPPPGKSPSQALFFRPSDLTQSLNHPLDDTLTPSTPSTTSVATSFDTPIVDRLTTPTLYSFSLTQSNQDASVFLVLSPLGLATTGTAPGP
jgi:hypothetical protein